MTAVEKDHILDKYIFDKYFYDTSNKMKRKHRAQ